MEMESHAALSNKKFKVLLFPWLGTAHITPYLELAKILTKKQHFQPYLCSTAINLTSIQKTFKNNAWDFPIEFIELRLPENPDFPPQYHTTKDIPTHLKSTLMDAFQKSQPNFSQILSDLKPDVVIYDAFQPWATKLALSMNIPCIHFSIISVAAASFFTHYSTRRAKDDTRGSYPFPEIHITEAESKRIFDSQSTRTHDLDDLASSSFELSTNYVLFNSCKEIEGKYMEHLSSLTGKKVVPLGPLIQEAVALDSHSHRHIIEWLESKTPSSVVFVSFGSECFLSKEEMHEIANGLELSNANFLWAIKFSEKDTMKELLPQGFLERVEERGLVLEGWAPQVKILKHPNTGGFLSHGGWNSVLESLYYGVPIIGVPIQYEQPLNTRSVVGLGVGVEVERDEHGRFDRVNIANGIKKVMDEKDGGLIGKKTRELKEKLKIEKEVNINGALQEFLKVCQERQTFT